VGDKVGCHAAAEILMAAPGKEAGCHTLTFLIPVILSEARHWRSQWLAQSKDPIPACANTNLAGSSPPFARQQHKNALTRPQRRPRYLGSFDYIVIRCANANSAQDDSPKL